jgi:hypothetical protein
MSNEAATATEGTARRVHAPAGLRRPGRQRLSSTIFEGDRPAFRPYASQQAAGALVFGIAAMSPMTTAHATPTSQRVGRSSCSVASTAAAHGVCQSRLSPMSQSMASE